MHQRPSPLLISGVIRAGLPQDFTGARHFVASKDKAIAELAKSQLATDYRYAQFGRSFPD